MLSPGSELVHRVIPRTLKSAYNKTVKQSTFLRIRSSPGNYIAPGVDKIWQEAFQSRSSDLLPLLSGFPAKRKAAMCV